MLTQVFSLSYPRIRKRALPQLNAAVEVNRSREDWSMPEMSCDPSSESRSSAVIV